MEIRHFLCGCSVVIQFRQNFPPYSRTDTHITESMLQVPEFKWKKQKNTRIIGKMTRKKKMLITVVVKAISEYSAQFQHRWNTQYQFQHTFYVCCHHRLCIADLSLMLCIYTFLICYLEILCANCLLSTLF